MTPMIIQVLFFTRGERKDVYLFFKESLASLLDQSEANHLFTCRSAISFPNFDTVSLESKPHCLEFPKLDQSQQN